MWHKFKLLLWKNWILVKRHPIAGKTFILHKFQENFIKFYYFFTAIFELLFPILIVVLFTYLRGQLDVEHHPEYHYTPFTPTSDQLKCRVGYMFINDEVTKLGYAPNNEFYKNLVDTALENKFEKFDFANEDDLNLWIRNMSAIQPVFGISFGDDEIVSLILSIGQR